MMLFLCTFCLVYDLQILIFGFSFWLANFSISLCIKSLVNRVTKSIFGVICRGLIRHITSTNLQPNSPNSQYFPNGSRPRCPSAGSRKCCWFDARCIRSAQNYCRRYRIRKGLSSIRFLFWPSQCDSLFCFDCRCSALIICRGNIIGSNICQTLRVSTRTRVWRFLCNERPGIFPILQCVW